MRIPLLAVLAALAVSTAAAAQVNPIVPGNQEQTVEIPRAPATAWVGMAMEQSSIRNEAGAMVSSLLVTAVAEGSPAEAAGLRAGDEIVTIDGCDPRHGVCVHWGRLVPGRPYRLRVRNDDGERDATLVPAPPRTPPANP